jgi:hypothetical protein
MKKCSLPRFGNVRLSLETKPEVKEAIQSHGKELGGWSIISAIRLSVARSKWLFDLERRGDLLLKRHADGKIVKVNYPDGETETLNDVPKNHSA